MIMPILYRFCTIFTQLLVKWAWARIGFPPPLPPIPMYFNSMAERINFVVHFSTASKQIG